MRVESSDVPRAFRSQAIAAVPLLACLHVCPLPLARQLGMINRSNIDGKGKKVEYCFQCNNIVIVLLFAQEQR